jgi:lysophospholipase L1-like esterase
MLRGRGWLRWRVPPARPLLLALVLAGSLLLGGSSGTALGAAPGPYVALGDSYTAGPLIPNQAGDPALCFRSDHDYPALLAQTLRPAAVRDVSCSGASTASMTQAQPLLSHSAPLGHNPPQFDALARDVATVTVQIGGNDLGFGDLALTCLSLGLLDPGGAPCRQRYTAGGVDQNAATTDAIAPRIAAVLQGIHARAPRARVLLVGYPDILPTSGPGCYPLVPIAAGDVPYLNGVELGLNRMLAAQAAANRATFVDTYTPSAGHDVCQAPGVKWVEGVIPTAAGFSLHPNELGMQAVAGEVAGVLHARAVPET